MATVVYGPRHLGNLPLPPELIQARKQEQANSATLISRYTPYFNNGVRRDRWEAVSGGAQFLQPYTAEPQVRKTLTLALREWHISQPDIYPLQDIFRALCPWKAIFPEIDTELTRIVPKGQTLRIYQTTPTYGTVTREDLKRIHAGSHQGQQNFFNLRKQDLTHTDIFTSHLEEDYKPDILAELLRIAFSPDYRSKFTEVVAMVAQATFGEIAEETNKDSLLKVRMIRALETICQEEELKIPDSFMEKLISPKVEKCLDISRIGGPALVLP
jgi:hypothetical protein